MGLFTSSKQAVEGFPMIPNSNFLLGHLPLMMEDDFRVSLHKFSVEHADENGRVCFWMGSTPALSVTRAKDVQYILKHSSHRTVFEQMKKHAEAFLGKRNIGMLTGKEWKTQRAPVVKAMHTATNLQSHTQAVMDTNRKLVKVLKERQQLGDSIEIGGLMKMLTLDTFGHTALHVDFGCIPALEQSEIAISFEYLTSEMMRRMTWGMMDPTTYSYRLPTRSNLRHGHHKKIVRGFINNLVQERRERRAAGRDYDTQDLLSELIKVHEKSCSTNEEIADETLTDTLVSLLFAGYETTAVTMTYALYLISQHEHVETRILEEIQQNEKSQSCDDYPYLNAVIMETLRLYPPAISTTRSLETALELDGIPIPQGTYLYVPIWTVQRDARNFDDPESFLPERWLALDQPHNGFVAFSSGARSCAGQRFAMMEMILSLVELLSNFKFHAMADYVLTPHRDGIVQTPKGGLPMKVKDRE